MANIYSKYKKNGQIFKKKRGHRPPILSDDQKEQLCDWVDEDCTLRLIDLKTKLMAKYPQIVTIGRTTIANSLKKFHYSFKRVTPVPEGRNTPEAIESRYRYAFQYNQMMGEKHKMLFIDETGYQISSRAKYGRSMVGAKAHKTVPVLRSRNYSVCAAMREDSLYFFEIQDRPYNSEHYSGFLTQLFEHLTNEGMTGAYIIMDNVRFHRTQEVIAIIEAHGHNPVFLPPYSPFLDPIEELFHQWKSAIRRSVPTNEDDLYTAVHNCSERITADNCRNYIRHSESYLIRCLNKEVIQS